MDILIFSTVRNNSEGNIGFMKVPDPAAMLCCMVWQHVMHLLVVLNKAWSRVEHMSVHCIILLLCKALNTLLESSEGNGHHIAGVFSGVPICARRMSAA